MCVWLRSLAVFEGVAGWGPGCGGWMTKSVITFGLTLNFRQGSAWKFETNSKLRPEIVFCEFPFSRLFSLIACFWGRHSNSPRNPMGGNKSKAQHKNEKVPVPEVKNRINTQNCQSIQRSTCWITNSPTSYLLHRFFFFGTTITAHFPFFSARPPPGRLYSIPTRIAFCFVGLCEGSPEGQEVGTGGRVGGSRSSRRYFNCYSEWTATVTNPKWFWCNF